VTPRRRSGEAPVPIYYRLQTELLKGIEEGRWGPGEAIWPERRIAKEFEVSLGTVNRALSNLVNEGYLYRMQGKGTFVAGTFFPRESVRYTRMRTDFESKDPKFKVKVLGLERIPGQQPVNQHLKLRINQELWRLERLFELREGKVAICVSYMPVKLFPDLDTIYASKFEKTTLYEVVEKTYGLPTVSNQEQFGAVGAPKEVARHLEIKPGEPLLLIKMRAYTYKERPYEYRVSYYLTQNRMMFREM
jgi:GntR family transcriptional regulator